MWDTSIPMIGLAMRADTLDDLPAFELPAHYGWRYFQPGDEHVWAEIETSAGEFKNPEDGVRRFRDYYPTDAHLAQRMIFLTDNGVPFATAGAWFEGNPDSREGHLHWVGIDKAHQEQGLSKPLVFLALRRMRELGHDSAYLTTQTASWVAVKVYHQFGFRPVIREEKEIEGWKIVSQKTGIDFMKEAETRHV